MLQKRALIGVGIGTLVILAVCVTLITLVYGITRRQWDGSVVRTFAKMTSFPAGKVGDQKALYVDYLSQVDAQAIYLQTEDARSRQLPTAVNADTKQAAFDQIMDIAALEQIAKEQGVAVTSANIEDAFNQFIAQSGTSTSAIEIDGVLRESFGWNRDNFKQFFIRPGALSQALREKMPGTTDEEKAGALQQKITDRLAQTDAKRYLIIAQ